MNYSFYYGYDFKDNKITFNIFDTNKTDHKNPLGRKVVWTGQFPIQDDYEGHQFPLEFRQEYERLLNRSEFVADAQPEEANLVEVVAGDDCAWDQPCAHGHRVEQHAVYCHNSFWLYAPRKCYRNRLDFKHENCPGFKSPDRKIE